MRARSLDQNEKGLPKCKSVEATACNIEDVELFVEELERVIAPGMLNHNQTLVSDSE